MNDSSVERIHPIDEPVSVRHAPVTVIHGTKEEDNIKSVQKNFEVNLENDFKI